VVTEDAQQQRDGDERMCDLRHAAIADRFENLWLRIEDRFDAQDKATRIALSSQEKAVAAAMTAAEKAVLKAEQLATSRADQQNEWRSAMNDVITQRVSREEYDAAHTVLTDKINVLTDRVNLHAGRGLGSSSTMIWIFLSITSFVSVLGIILDLTIRH
jgi:hypothetical protein